MLIYSHPIKHIILCVCVYVCVCVCVCCHPTIAFFIIQWFRLFSMLPFLVATQLVGAILVIVHHVIDVVLARAIVLSSLSVLLFLWKFGWIFSIMEYSTSKRSSPSNCRYWSGKRERIVYVHVLLSFPVTLPFSEWKRGGNTKGDGTLMTPINLLYGINFFL